MRSIEAITADGSKSPSGMAYTVLRIIMGGSAGLRMMIAFPRCAPPITAKAVDVVSVNSSIFFLVPGPAERLAVVLIISAERTGGTPPPAEVIGGVARPPPGNTFEF